MQDLNQAKPPNPVLHSLDAPDTKVEPNLDRTRVSATGPEGDLDTGKTRPEHARDSFPREKYGVFRTSLSRENELPPDLAAVVDAWPRLSPAQRQAIVKIVQATAKAAKGK